MSECCINSSPKVDVWKRDDGESLKWKKAALCESFMQLKYFFMQIFVSSLSDVADFLGVDKEKTEQNEGS